MTKLKFKVTQIEPGNEQPEIGQSVTLEPVEGTGTKDDQGNWDVIGRLKLKTLDKNKAEEKFEPGGLYELSLTKVDNFDGYKSGPVPGEARPVNINETGYERPAVKLDGGSKPIPGQSVQEPQVTNDSASEFNR